MIMNVTIKRLPLVIMFLVIFFWDIVEDFIPKFQFLILIFLFIFFFEKIKLAKYKRFLFIWLFALIHGLICCYLGLDSISLLFKQLLCIGVCFIVFTSAVTKYSVATVFKYYWNMASIMAFLGVIQVVAGLLNITVLANTPLFYFTNFYYRIGPFIKISSLCREPSFLVYLLAPAACMVLTHFISPELVPNIKLTKLRKFQAICIVFSYLFTFSAVGVFGIALALIILWMQKELTFKKIIIPVLGCAFFALIYIKIPEISTRINSLLDLLFDSNDMIDSNLSSFTYFANFKVMKSTFKATYGLGAGLGGYQNMFDRFSIGGWSNTGLALNREDANSALFRILSELGIFGGVGIIIFIKKYFPPKTKESGFSIAMLVLLLLFLLRQGNYIHAGSILFVCMYIQNYYECKVRKYDR